jgi:DNA-binding PadR family transcriptional regulator
VADFKLTTASYLVLGLVEFAQPVTPYELKQLAADSVLNFWSLPHTQIYTQCDRLTEAGLMSEKREQTGRRRRSFSLTKDGKKAMDDWRADVEQVHMELRDIGLLKLFFGADPKDLSESQYAAHRERLDKYEEVNDKFRKFMPDGQQRTLDQGLRFEREFMNFWKRQRD